MSDTGGDKTQKLRALRDRIDSIDTQMHRLLMERGGVIESLIEVKGTSRPGAAFRPAREADMMRRIAARHSGDLPLATVEHIWREIIATFTWVQAPFDVAIDRSTAPDEMRDLARFIFGFSVNLRPMNSPQAVVAHVAAGRDLGLIARNAGSPWWEDLDATDGPQIIAGLPFITDSAAAIGVPAFVVAPRLAEPFGAEVSVFAAEVEGPVVVADEIIVVADHATAKGKSLLLADFGGRDTAAVRAVLEAGGGVLHALKAVGGFARPITSAGQPVAADQFTRTEPAA